MFRIFLTVIMGAFSFSVVAQQKVKNVSPSAFQTLQKSTAAYNLIDVRTPDEFKSGHLKDAVNLNYQSDNFKTQVAKLDRGKLVLVYCAAGGRSAKAVDVMKQLGFQTVYNLDGGVKAWEGEGLPLVK